MGALYIKKGLEIEKFMNGAGFYYSFFFFFFTYFFYNKDIKGILELEHQILPIYLLLVYLAK